MSRARFGLAAVATALASACVVLGAGGAQAVPFPVTTDAASAIATRYLSPASESPPGANRFACRDREGRDPVLLLHATAMNQSANWAYLAPTLANAGYCVFSLTYGQTSWSGNTGGLGNKEKSARQVAAFLDRVLDATGAAKVDFVGHSQGGAIAQLVTQLTGRAEQVDTIVGLSASNQGYSRVGALTDRLPARAPGQSYWGPRRPSIRYVNLATRYDEISTPYQLTLMSPGGPNVVNSVIQEVCPASTIGHVGMAYSPTVAALVRNALDPRHRTPVPCGQDYPL
ncbi:alpha/beta fold hydrolase [Gordonia sp. zg691]|uniref:Alpha/beta fold hydrolase n=1 Tax=Gordonia jinghuaiqii TaxID=2758710 RepID=A0A7D7R0I4_9ACTN|nr:alpha/beta fold hydrolase [Gordonia jinghuaiqii]MBD0863297.1 alpha/beta fold hydrolase [Gordonia jinghuaiqii]MCR5980191.1 alpha/beta fold hydrolase [Gordonia jinghuaiqii]QMT02051.1 alpha/beta fold hydrolase [Gordonia jinghuaiqii]